MSRWRCRKPAAPPADRRRPLLRLALRRRAAVVLAAALVALRRPAPAVAPLRVAPARLRRARLLRAWPRAPRGVRRTNHGWPRTPVATGRAPDESAAGPPAAQLQRMPRAAAAPAR